VKPHAAKLSQHGLRGLYRPATKMERAAEHLPEFLTCHQLILFEAELRVHG
jgi:hypothetical protein